MRLQLPSSDYIELREFGNPVTSERASARRRFCREFWETIIRQFSIRNDGVYRSSRNRGCDAITRVYRVFVHLFLLLLVAACGGTRITKGASPRVFECTLFATAVKSFRNGGTAARFCKIKPFYSNRMYLHAGRRGKGEKVGHEGKFLSGVFLFVQLWTRLFVSPRLASHRFPLTKLP